MDGKDARERGVAGVCLWPLFARKMTATVTARCGLLVLLSRRARGSAARRKTTGGRQRLASGPHLFLALLLAGTHTCPALHPPTLSRSKTGCVVAMVSAGRMRRRCYLGAGGMVGSEVRARAAPGRSCCCATGVRAEQRIANLYASLSLSLLSFSLSLRPPGMLAARRSRTDYWAAHYWPLRRSSSPTTRCGPSSP